MVGRRGLFLLLPLGGIDLVASGCGLSRSAVRRLRRRLAVNEVANDAMHALNSLEGRRNASDHRGFVFKQDRTCSRKTHSVLLHH